MKLTTIRRQDAESILTWQYPPPYNFYDMNSASIESFFNPESPHISVLDENNQPIGFMSIGVESQVPGGDYSQPAVDIGIGLRPDCTGRGLGKLVLQQFFDDIVTPGDHPPLLRATIAAFNQRSLRTFFALGFEESSCFTTQLDDRQIEWIIVTRTR